MTEVIENVPTQTRSGLHVGITASRSTRPPAQLATLEFYLRHLSSRGFSNWHDGDCVGGDYQGHRLAAHLDYWTIGHPPLETQYRAFSDFDEVRTPKDFLTRNHDIVDESDYLIGMPDSHEERLRSGTWSTLRYARKIRRPGCVIYPDGTVKSIVEALT